MSLTFRPEQPYPGVRKRCDCGGEIEFPPAMKEASIATAKVAGCYISTVRVDGEVVHKCLPNNRRTDLAYAIQAERLVGRP